MNLVSFFDHRNWKAVLIPMLHLFQCFILGQFQVKRSVVDKVHLLAVHDDFVAMQILPLQFPIENKL